MDKRKILIIVSLIIAAIIIGTIGIVINNKKTITYNISFETDGGSKIESQTVNEGKKVKKPIDPTKEGYTFVEWTYKGETYDFTLEVKSDIVLIAKWAKQQENIESFVVKFNSDGGTTISNQIIEKGNKLQKPTNPLKEGYKFNGWTLNGKSYDFNTVVEKDLELKAKWEKVEEKEKNKNENNTNKTNNNSSEKKNNTTNKNNANSTNKDKVTNSSSNTSTTVPTIKKYKVTFNSNGGSSVASQTIKTGSKAKKPTNPTRRGYNFAGWTLNGKTYNFGSAVNSNITLVAKWNQKSYTLKISAVDDYSPARVLSVYEDGIKITVKEIKYSDGTYLCSGANPNVNKNVIAGETAFIVVLDNGIQVTARVN